MSGVLTVVFEVELDEEDEETALIRIRNGSIEPTEFSWEGDDEEEGDE